MGLVRDWTGKDKDKEGQGPSLQGPGQGQGLDLQGQEQGQGLRFGP